MSDSIANLQAYLTSVGLKPLAGPDLKDAKKDPPSYLVLYTGRDAPDKFIVGHPIKDKHTVDCMVKWEIYCKVRVVDLSDSSVVLEQFKFPTLDGKSGM